VLARARRRKARGRWMWFKVILMICISSEQADLAY
jgi:hypothetical protein